MLTPVTAVCLMAAAQAYSVPLESLYSILRVERGWIGLAKPNLRKDGSVRSEDLGPFQINTAWLSELTDFWKLPDQTRTYELLRDDGCVGAYAASAIVRYHWIKTGSLTKAIVVYHAGPKGRMDEMAKYLNRYNEALAELLNAARTYR